ncbi:hypothetical protein [Paenibacillus sp. PAMC21692]|uniref:hypothetical protein n=1 Tax=Paenibacillus sp. PAMC21692 TaxID=2762320 RepID=UPI00164E39B3|nr:hypothetical protein [Paenibacillus sp. PAMC21692]QNK56708.1 hypothetical protein H7F31_29980 [Paenibacillus sp. PAMC21692]
MMDFQQSIAIKQNSRALTNLAMLFRVFGDAILPVGENGQDFVAFAGALFQRINITLGVFANLNVFANKLLFPFVGSGAHSVPCIVGDGGCCSTPHADAYRPLATYM